MRDNGDIVLAEETVRKVRVARERAPIIDTTQGLTFQTSGGWFDPDAIVKAKSWEIYEEMRRREPRIVRYLGFLKDALLSGGQEAVAGDENTEQKRIDFCRWMMDYIVGSWSRVPRRIMSAFEDGVSISEKVLAYAEDGPFAGKVYLKDLKGKHPKFFNFDQDEFGNLKPDGLVQFWQQANEVRHNVSDFVIYSHDSEYGNLWGRPILQPLYEAYFTKQVLPRHAKVALEKTASGVTVLKVPAGTPKAEKDAMVVALSRMHGACDYVVEEGSEFELIPFQAQGFDALMKFLDRCDTDIAIGIGIPPMLWNTVQVGSYARTAQDFEAALIIYRNMQETIDDVITEQIFRPLCQLNFGPGPCPHHKSKPVEVGGIEAVLKRYQAMSQAGLKPTPEIVSKDLGVDEGEVEEKPAPEPFGGEKVPGNGSQGPSVGNQKAGPVGKAARFAEGAGEGFYQPRREPTPGPESRIDFAGLPAAANNAVQEGARALAMAFEIQRKAMLAALRMEAGEAARPLAPTPSSGLPSPRPGLSSESGRPS